MIGRVKNVLVAYDGSSAARRALAHTAELANGDARISVVNVMHESGVSARLEPPAERRRQDEILGDAERYLADCGIQGRMLARVGDNTAHQILRAADEVAADVVVVARRRGPAAHVLGSTSSRIVHSANCDVLVVHEGSPEPD